MTILETMRDPKLFGPWFTDRLSWRAWEAFLSALFGLPMDDPEMVEIFRKHTNRTVVPLHPMREAWVIVGRRGGKSRIAASVAVFLACFRNYTQYLAPGEVGTLAVIAADRQQARIVMDYIGALFDNVEMLRELVVAQKKESIELANRVRIEVHTASFRGVRGYSLVGVVCDEIAFWRTDDGSANPDTEILAALRPGMATIPGALLIAISSPYARRGALWEAHRRHFGRDGDPVLVWQADTRAMNPRVDQQIIQDEYDKDPVAASSEYGALFRTDIDAFVPREAVEAVVVPRRLELPPRPGISYRAFADPSGGSSDSMTLAIAHREGDKLILDCIRECRPPFRPSDVVAEFATVMKSYGVTTVIGDHYGGEWPREQFRVHGIYYKTADMVKSELYLELLPRVMGCRVELLDNAKLITQLCGLERRTSRSGRDSIDHGLGGHDDVVNAVAGAIERAGREVAWHMAPEEESERPLRQNDIYNAQLEEHMTQSYPGYGESDDLTCGHCLHRDDRKDGKCRCSLRKFLVKKDQPACDRIDVAAP
jgi:hypothetical protein